MNRTTDPERRRHFIVRTIGTSPRSSFLDALAFLGLFRVNTYDLKQRYRFVDPQLRGEFEAVRQRFSGSYVASLPNIPPAERERMAEFRPEEINGPAQKVLRQEGGHGMPSD